MARSKKSSKIHHTESFLKRHRRRQERFLLAFEKTLHQGLACQEAGITSSAVFKWRRDDTVFEEKYLAIEETIGKAAEDEAIRRAFRGVERGIYYEGQRVALETEYSDTLLAKILSARNKAYSRAADDVLGNADRPIIINIIPHKPGQDDKQPAT